MSDRPFRILVLCAHNRTRSVMAAALLRHHLGDDARFAVETAGFGPEGLPALPEAVVLLAERGIDVSEHRSRRCTPELVAAADLVLTAEKAQVLAVVADCGGDFDRTFTVPEYVSRQTGANSERPRGLAYLTANVGEVFDPSGSTKETWRQSATQVDRVTRGISSTLRRSHGECRA